MWSKTVAWVAPTEAVSALARLNDLAERSLTTRRRERPTLYAEFGTPLAETSLAGQELRKGKSQRVMESLRPTRRAASLNPTAEQGFPEWIAAGLPIGVPP